MDGSKAFGAERMLKNKNKTMFTLTTLITTTIYYNLPKEQKVEATNNRTRMVNILQES